MVLKKICLLAGLSIALLTSSTVSAERIRACDGDLIVSYYKLVPNHTGRALASEYLGGAPKLDFWSTGKHGGILPNTARSRAKGRMIDCFNEMLQFPDLPSEKISSCNDPYDHDYRDMAYQLNGRSLSEYLYMPENVRSACNNSTYRGDNENVSIKAGLKLVSSGGPNCGAKLESDLLVDYSVNLGLLGNFCETGNLYNSLSYRPKPYVKKLNVAARVMTALNTGYMSAQYNDSDYFQLVTDGNVGIQSTREREREYARELAPVLTEAMTGDQSFASVEDREYFFSTKRYPISTDFAEYCDYIPDTSNGELIHRRRLDECAAGGKPRALDMSGFRFSENGRYAIDPNDEGSLYVRDADGPGESGDASAAIEIAQHDGFADVVVHNQSRYIRYVPTRLFFPDCCHTAQEVITNTQFDFTANNAARLYFPNSAGIGSLTSQNYLAFGEFLYPYNGILDEGIYLPQKLFDYFQKLLGINSNRDTRARPNIGQAYATIRTQQPPAGVTGPPYHIAAVILIDGNTRITLEATADPNDTNPSQNPNREGAVFDMYGGGQATFHTRYRQQYGSTATTLVVDNLKELDERKTKKRRKK